MGHLQVQNAIITMMIIFRQVHIVLPDVFLVFIYYSYYLLLLWLLWLLWFLSASALASSQLSPKTGRCDASRHRSWNNYRKITKSVTRYYSLCGEQTWFVTMEKKMAWNKNIAPYRVEIRQLRTDRNVGHRVYIEISRSDTCKIGHRFYSRL